MSDDNVLIHAASRGDASAFRTLVERYKKTVYYIAYDLTGQHHTAEDLSQDVFLKMYRGLGTFRGDATLRTWLYRVTVNTYLSQQRKKAFTALNFFSDHKKDDCDLTDVIPAEDEHSPEKMAEAVMMQTHIQAALNKLSPRERTVFTLRHYQDLSLKEIADIMDVRIGTVKSTLFRAIQRMQKALAFYKLDFNA
ncbi:RNA polymerase sigma factor [candidate division KSB1 bacterium]|nr:RNA polymerase sigma factor [candidate division KSB1 bacterium]